MTVNERLYDFQVIQQIRWIRVANLNARDIRRILRRNDERLRAILAREDLTEFTRARTQILRAQVEELLTTFHNTTVADEMRRNVEDIAATSAQVEQEAIRRSLPAEARSALDVVTPNPGLVQRATLESQFNGLNLDEWLDGLRQADLRRTWATIQDGLISGRTTDEIIRDVIGSRSLRYKDGAREVTRRGAEALVRTSINHAASQGRQSVWEANEDIIAAVRWVSTLDHNTTPICRVRDGRVGPINAGDAINIPGAKLLDPPFARPPAHPNCRSTTVAITKSFRDLGFDVDEIRPVTRSALDGKVSAETTYFQWLERQSAAVQKEALGPSRYRLWKQGGISPEKFQNDKGHLFTLDELRSKMPDAYKDAFGDD